MTETTMTDELHSVAAYFIGAPGDETDQRIRQIFENHGGEFIHEGGPWRKPPAPSSTSEPSKEREVVYEVAATEIDAVETELKTAGVNEVVVDDFMDDSPESDFIDSVTYVRAQLSVVRDGGGTYDNLLLTKHCAEILSDAVKEYEKATD